MKKLLLPALLSLLSLVPALAQVRSVGQFHAIRVSSGISLELTAGASQRVAVDVSPAAFAPYLTTTVEGGTLVLGYKNPNDPNGRERSRQHVQLRVAVTADQLTALTAGSGSTVRGTGSFAASSFRLDVSSGATIKSDMSTDQLDVDQSSGSTVTLQGRATKFDLDLSSGATFDGDDLKTERSHIEASSGSSAEVAVKDDLVAEASSGASIRYHGSPQLTKRTSSGGSVSGH